MNRGGAAARLRRTTCSEQTPDHHSRERRNIGGNTFLTSEIANYPGLQQYPRWRGRL